jgi:hypothetical protein
MRGTVAKLATAATLGLLAGCALATSGLLAPTAGDPGGADASTPAPSTTDATTGSVPPPGTDGSITGDGGTPSDDAPATSSADASAEDATSTTDAACPAAAQDAAVSVVTSIAPPPKIDGDLSDWGCGPWTTLDTANAAYTLQNGQALAGVFAVRWDSAALYFAAHIVVATLQGSDGTNPYNNDAVEIYVSGDSPLTGDYDATSHQYIIDWHNLAVDYGSLHYPPNQPSTSPKSFTSQTKQVADGWQIEAAIAWPALVKGKAPTSGAKLALDVAFDDGDGTELKSQLVETLATHSLTCGCQSCCCGEVSPSPDMPNCDTLCFAGVTLQ